MRNGRRIAAESSQAWWRKTVGGGGGGYAWEIFLSARSVGRKATTNVSAMQSLMMRPEAQT
jgi:hypothetical protein